MVLTACVPVPENNSGDVAEAVSVALPLVPDRLTVSGMDRVTASPSLRLWLPWAAAQDVTPVQAPVNANAIAPPLLLLVFVTVKDAEPLVDCAPSVCVPPVTLTA
jgi:hypothetical protein